MAFIIRGHGEDANFDEEVKDKEAFEIQGLVEAFVDEQPVRHDVMPECDSEDEGKRNPARERTHIRRGDGRLYKNQSFFNGIAFKEAVLDYALRIGRNIKQYMYDQDKIMFKCVGGDSEGEGYSWQIYASTLPKDGMWKVRVFSDKHSCVPNGECEMLKVPQIAILFLDKIREEPDYFLHMKIKETIKDRWNIVVSRHQCQAAENKAMKWIESEYDLQFVRLHDYAAESKLSNQNSTVLSETITNPEKKDELDRFYVCFDVLRKTWQQTCRPLIKMDECFLKHKRIKEDLGLNDRDEYVMVSDRQKGLVKAVGLELPKIEYMMCVRHIYTNLKKNYGSKKQMKPFLWNLAWSYNQTEYDERMDRLYNYDVGVWNDVKRTNLQSWYRAFFKLGNYYEDVENNSTESFNNTINEAREKPFVPMLETVRRLTMARIANRSAISIAHTGICTSYVTQFLAAEQHRASECRITRSTNNQYEARISGCAYRVSLENKTCTCKNFDFTGIPCEHTYEVIMVKKLVPEDYVCQGFHTAMWR